MAAPEDLPADVTRRIAWLAGLIHAYSAREVRGARMYAHLIGSVIASTLFLGSGLPPAFEIVCYVGAFGCAAVGVGMHLTLRELGEREPWQWWAWTASVVAVAVLDIAVDL